MIPFFVVTSAKESYLTRVDIMAHLEVWMSFSFFSEESGWYRKWVLLIWGSNVNRMNDGESNKMV